MKIYFDNVNFEAVHTGPNCFASRLAEQLSYMGHEIVDHNDDYDFALVFIEPTSRLNQKKPFLLRLDGIWMKPEEFLSKNVGIKWAYENAKHVIWQSEFDRNMSSHHWGKRTGTVVRNGAKFDDIEVRSEALLELREKNDFVFCCSSNWHPQKRLKENVRLFQELRKKHPKSKLIVMGNNPDHIVSDPNIFYTGSIRHDLCAEVYKISDWMIHLAWLDHAPNVCYEALRLGTPIICSSEGGTKELVSLGNGGIVLSDDKKFEYELVDYDNPPSLNFQEIDIITKQAVDKDQYSIEKSAKAYEAVFKEVFG